VPTSSGVRSRIGLYVRRCDLSEGNITNVRRLRATTVQRTLADLCFRWRAVEALVAIDAAIHAGLTDKAALVRLSVGRLRSLALVAAPAESPMETRLRWLLLQARLPNPEVQVDLHDARGRFVGRADLYWSAAHLVVEYDGYNHRERLVEDNRRQNLLIGAGYRLLRFTAADINQRPEAVQAQVRKVLNCAPLAPMVPNPPSSFEPLDPMRRNPSRSR